MDIPAVSLTHREFLRIDRNYAQAAKAASLKYITDTSRGITRLRKEKGFSYMLERKAICDKDEILRIRKLAIPPAWTDVWICVDRMGHIQATGFDLRAIFI